MLRLLLSTALLCGCATAPIRAPVSPIEDATVVAARAEAQALPAYRVGSEFEAAGVRVVVDGIVVASAALEFEAPCTIDGRLVRPLSVAGGTIGLARLIKPRSGEGTTWLDPETGYPVVEMGLEQSPVRDRHVIVDFRGRKDAFYLDYTSSSDKGSHHATTWFALPKDAHAHSLASLAEALRHWDAQPGDDAYAYLVFKRRLWRVELRFVGPERLRVHGDWASGLRIEGTATKLPAKQLKPKRRKRRRQRHPRTKGVTAAQMREGIRKRDAKKKADDEQRKADANKKSQASARDQATAKKKTAGAEVAAAPKPEQRHFTVWLSADDVRAPLTARIVTLKHSYQLDRLRYQRGPAAEHSERGTSRIGSIAPCGTSVE